MKKLMGLFAGFAVAVATLVALSAAGSTPVSATSCVSGTSYKDFDGSYSGRDTLTVWTVGNKPLCKDVDVNFTTFEVLNTYNGNGFKNNPTALPQKSYWNKTVTLKKGTNGKTTVKMTVPNACTDYQLDAYIGPVQTKITTNEGLVDTNAIVGKLFKRLKNDCSVKVCNPANGQIISVPEEDASKYKPVGDIACQPPVQVCNPANGQTITVPAADADKYKPVGDAACGDVKVCDPATGKVITVKKSDAGNYKPEGDAACVETPGKGGDTPETLPSTGPAEAVSALFGVGSLAGAGTAYVRSRLALRK